MLANSDFKPCNPDRPAGSQSACCNLWKSPVDIYLGGGLYEDEETNNGNAMIFAVGCTDPSGKDPRATAGVSGISGRLSGRSVTGPLESFGGRSESVEVDSRLSVPA